MTDSPTRVTEQQWHHAVPGAAVALMAAAATLLPGLAVAQDVYLRAGLVGRPMFPSRSWWVVAPHRLPKREGPGLAASPQWGPRGYRPGSGATTSASTTAGAHRRGRLPGSPDGTPIARAVGRPSPPKWGWPGGGFAPAEGLIRVRTPWRRRGSGVRCPLGPSCRDVDIPIIRHLDM